MTRATVQLLSGDRLHLSDGPIDVVIGADGPPGARDAAFRAAAGRFVSILDELCGELALLRAPSGPGARPPASPVGRRMARACRPFEDVFVTPMAAVAGAVADELLGVMRAAAPLRRAFVNDGGDVAVHVAPGHVLTLGLAGSGRRVDPSGSVTVRGGDGVGGVATSGAGGRSFSLGIADWVTVLAADAASADAAATLIANAVDADDPAIVRVAARRLDPDADLGDLPVVTRVGRLTPGAVAKALDAGRLRALEYVADGRVLGAALSLAGEVVTVGRSAWPGIGRRAS